MPRSVLPARFISFFAPKTAFIDEFLFLFPDLQFAITIE